MLRKGVLRGVELVPERLNQKYFLGALPQTPSGELTALFTGVFSGQFCPNREAAKQAAKCCSCRKFQLGL